MLNDSRNNNGIDNSMPIRVTNRVILISELPRIRPQLKIALGRSGFEFETEYPALTSLQIIRTAIARTAKTAFMRTELLKFIKEKGFPAAFILDDRMDLGIARELDPDGLKVLRTILIAYIILKHGRECRSIRGHIILLSKGPTFGMETGIATDPHRIMRLLSSQNPEINMFIDELKNDRDAFDNLFKITLIDTETSSDKISGAVTDALLRINDAGAGVAG